MPPHKKLKVKRPWQSIAGEAQAERDSSLATVELLAQLPERLPSNVTRVPDRLLNGEELRLTSLPPEEIVRLTSAGRLSVYDVTQTFLRRAIIAQRLVSTYYSSAFSQS